MNIDIVIEYKKEPRLEMKVETEIIETKIEKIGIETKFESKPDLKIKSKDSSSRSIIKLLEENKFDIRSNYIKVKEALENQRWL
jgi:hypothetical protein